jgi:hypothetical protein
VRLAFLHEMEANKLAMSCSLMDGKHQP